MPEELATLIKRLNHELDIIEREANDGIRVANEILEQFPDNFAIIQLFAFLNSSLFFVSTSRQRIEDYLNDIVNADILQQDKINEVGQDLAVELGRTLETKVTVIHINARLENLR
jgi:hypothetical protein